MTDTPTPAEAVAAALSGLAVDHDGDFGGMPAAPGTVQSYAEAALLTFSAGFVLTLDDGSQFQVTVVQTRDAD